MKHFKIFLAFTLGCLITLIIGRIAVRVRAQDEGGPVSVCVAQDGVLRVAPYEAGCPAGQRRLLLKKADSIVDLGKKEKKDEDTSSLDKTILQDLNRRLIKLEGMDCAALGKSRVVAPFEVVDREGKKIFSVTNERTAKLYNSSGNAVAQIYGAVGDGNGAFNANSSDSNFAVSFGVGPSGSPSLGIDENGKLRIVLGKDPQQGNYRLKFFSSSGKDVAGIGASSTDNSGLAIISDTAGISKAYVGVNSEGAGYFQLMGGKRFPIAELTEGKYKGGKLTLFSTSAVPMVEAGELESGVGTVWAGPMGFNPGVGLLGLPGSFIMGKNQ